MNPFAIQIETMNDSIPVLPNGIYAGIVTKVTTADKNGPTIKVSEVMEPESKNSKTMVPTGRYKLRGTLNYSITLISEKAKEFLGMDKPMMFGRSYLVFDQETGILHPAKNPIFVQLCKLFHIDPAEINSAIDMDEVEVAEVPKELEHVENIEVLVKAAAYYNQFFDLLARQITDQKCMVNVKQQKSYGDPNVMEARIFQGSGGLPSLSGLSNYEEGAENDKD